jgi:hypothetical protein
MSGERILDDWFTGPKASRAEQDHYAERYEREWLEPHQGRIRYLRALSRPGGSRSTRVVVSGCGPSLFQIWEPVVACNNSWRLQKPNDLLCVVFIDTQRFITQAPSVPPWLPICAIPSQCKQVRAMEEWFRVAEQIGDRLIPLRGAGRNGRNTRAYEVKELNTEKCVTSLGGSVLFTAIQLAAYIATREVVVIGADFDYDGPSRHWDGQPRYYEKGAHTMWENGGRDAMMHLYSKLGEAGIVLKNGTTGGKIDCLPRWP